MNWKLKLEQKGIEVLPHLSVDGKNIGWFNFIHPKGYICLYQSRCFGVVNSLEDWTNKGIYVSTDFEKFMNEIEYYVPGNYFEFENHIISAINELKDKAKRGFIYFNKKIMEQLNAENDFESKKNKLIEIATNRYNERRNTNYIFDESIKIENYKWTDGLDDVELETSSINNLEPIVQFILKANEIVVNACAVKYHDIDYKDEYIVVTQNRTRRRVKNGYYFEDTGTHIYLSVYVAGMFQHKYKERKFILNTETKEFRDYKTVIIEKHKPEKLEALKDNIINELKR